MTTRMRRTILKGVSVTLPVAWVAPVVESVLLPAHAQSSPMSPREVECGTIPQMTVMGDCNGGFYGDTRVWRIGITGSDCSITEVGTANQECDVWIDMNGGTNGTPPRPAVVQVCFYRSGSMNIVCSGDDTVQQSTCGAAENDTVDVSCDGIRVAGPVSIDAGGNITAGPFSVLLT